MAWCDFVDCAVEAGRAETVDLTELGELMSRLDSHTIDQGDFLDLLYVGLMLTMALRTFVTEVGGVHSWVTCLYSQKTSNSSQVHLPSQVTQLQTSKFKFARA